MPGKRANSEGSITKRKDGLWGARIPVEGGKRESFYAKTMQEASRKLAEAVRDRDQGVQVVSGRQTVAQYLTTWLDTLIAIIRPRTLQRSEQYVRVHLIPALGDISLKKLTAQRAQALYTSKLAPVVTSRLATAHPPVGGFQRAFGCAVPARVKDARAIGKRGERLNA
jgi:integrase